MKKYLLLTLLLVFNIGFAEISTKLDRNLIAVNETVNVIITMDSINNRDELDLSALSQDFTMVSRGTSSETTIINGKKSQKLQWIITLMPKRTGLLTIPAIKIGNESTPAINVTVKAAPTTSQATNASVFLTANVNLKNAYVGSPVDYIVKLYYQGNALLNGQLIGPQLNSIMFKPVGKVRQYQVQRHDKMYSVAEWHYMFFPQHAGTLKIPGVVFNGAIPLLASTMPNHYLTLSGGRAIKLTAPEVSLSVKALPATAAFAAKQVKLQSSWASSPPTWQVGQPVTRILRLQVIGTGGEQLPAISDSSLAGVKLYPDQAHLNTQMNNGEIEGIREEKIAYIPQQVGSITLPEIKIDWVNINTGKIEIVSLPAETYTVTGTTAATIPSPTTTEAPRTVTSNLGSESMVSELSNNHSWLWLTITIAVLWLLTLLLWWRSYHAKKIVKNITVPVSPQQIRQLIREACNKNDAKLLQQATLQWAQYTWPTANICNLGDVTAQAIAPVWRAELQKLNELIYKNADTKCDGHRCWLAFIAQENYQPVTNTNISDDLPPLHPR